MLLLILTRKETAWCQQRWVQECPKSFHFLCPLSVIILLLLKSNILLSQSVHNCTLVEFETNCFYCIRKRKPLVARFTSPCCWRKPKRGRSAGVSRWGYNWWRSHLVQRPCWLRLVMRIHEDMLVEVNDDVVISITIMVNNATIFLTGHADWG